MYGYRGQIGFIVPANNTVFEPELYHLVPDGISFHFTKRSIGDRFPSNKPHDDESADMFQQAGVDVVVYACMASSLVEAGKWERATTERTGKPAVTAATATMEALRAVEAHSVALVCHYSEDRLGPLNDSFESEGFSVVSTRTAGVTGVMEMNHIPVEGIYRLAQEADCPEADAICILAINLRSFPVLQQLELDLGKPVISTNQAILWKALHLAGIQPDIKGYGRLLSSSIA